MRSQYKPLESGIDMTVEVKVPSFGESVSSVVLVEWLKQVGDAVASGEELVEVESD